MPVGHSMGGREYGMAPLAFFQRGASEAVKQTEPRSLRAPVACSDYLSGGGFLKIGAP